MIDITQVLIALIGLISLVVTSVIVPLIKAKTSTAQWNAILLWTTTAVTAAESLYKGSGRGDEKFEYVLNWVEQEAKKKGIKIDADELNLVVESIWKQLFDKGDK